MSPNFRMHSDHNNTSEWLSLKGSEARVLLSVLTLSGSRLAQEVKEKELIVWISEHDRVVMGSGYEDFDISDLPWDFENFENERTFIIRVIEGAKQKLGWETLSYQPIEDYVFLCLDNFYNLIINFDPNYIDKEAYVNWINEKPEWLLPTGFPNCDERELKRGNNILNDYDKVIKEFEQHLDKETYQTWAREQKFPFITRPEGFPKCSKHDVFLYWHGCIVCNDC